MNDCLTSFIKKALIIFAGVLTSCLILETILQFTDLKTYNAAYNDPDTGLLIFKPNSKFHTEGTCFENDTTINSVGFNAKKFDPEKKSDIFRIIIVGSSFTEALQVPLEKSYPFLLEKELNSDPNKKFAYEVIPFGVSGNGTYLNMIYYEKYAKYLQPDLVIELATEYELTRNAPSTFYSPRFDDKGQAILDLPENSQAGVKVLAKNILRNSKLAMNLYYRYLMAASRIKNFVSKPSLFAQTKENALAAEHSDNDELQKNLWDIERKLLSQFSKSINEQKSNFLLITWFSDDVSAKYIQNYTEIAKISGFPYADMTFKLKEMRAEENRSPIWSCDGHWNEFGHKWIAVGIYEHFRVNPALIWK